MYFSIANPVQEYSHLSYDAVRCFGAHTIMYYYINNCLIIAIRKSSSCSLENVFGISKFTTSASTGES